MSKLIVNLENEDKIEGPDEKTEEGAEDPTRPRKGVVRKIFTVLVVSFLIIAVIGGLGGFVYWEYMKSTPEYSLALLVDAARRDDQEAIDELIDTDSVVEDFVPQIVSKAVELYGKGLAPSIIASITRVATPFLPVIKRRARAEFPGFLRDKTRKYEDIPFQFMVIGARRYLEIEYEGEFAIVKSRDPDRPLSVKMKRNNSRWRITKVNDEQLAQQIAEKIGQEMIALARKRGADTINDLGDRIGVPNLGEIFKQAEKVYK